MTLQPLEIAKQLLENSEVVAIPTETVYGLAANAYNVQAVTKIFQIKNRPTFDPLIVHTHSLEALNDFVSHVPEKALILAKHFWAGALTLLLPKKNNIPDLVTAGLPRVAVRVPNHPLTLQLLQNLSFPLAAPSANPFGYVSPTSAQHVAQQLGDKIPYILDGGNCNIGIESTIIGFENEQTWVYRLGGIPIENIQQLIGEVNIKPNSNANPANPEAAGMLSSHYATKTALMVGNLEQLFQKYTQIYLPNQIGILSFDQNIHTQYPQNQIILSPQADLAEATQKLFASMRHLDTLPLKIILAPIFPQKGLGRAINDRLLRASAIEK